MCGDVTAVTMAICSRHAASFASTKDSLSAPISRDCGTKKGPEEIPSLFYFD
jgi:hypothetical protein